MMSDSGQVVIVGGGILGTMHAVLARRRGFAVTHLEREPEGRGASVRNFGLVWVSGRRAGAELDLALRARELWESIAADAPGTGFRPAGSLTIAANEAELAVMRELIKAAGKPLSRAALLDAAWGAGELEISERAVDNVILRLRRKLPRPEALETVRSIGFRLTT